MENLNFIALLVASAIVSLLAVNWVYFKVLRIAKLKGMVDNPDARKLQKEPVPVMGGIAVFFGVVAGLLFATGFVNYLGLEYTARLMPVMCIMGVMLYTGTMDDIMGLTPMSRLVIEILSIIALIYSAGGCIDSFHGLWGIEAYSWWYAVPLTVFAGVGIINAVNMIDGVNGLSSGLCMWWCLCFGVMFIALGDMTNAMLALVMMSSIFPFYLHNVFGKHSRMFVGDAGTMVMGILMMCFTVSVLRSDSVTLLNVENVNRIAFTVAVLSVPVFDTLRVMTMRMLKKQSPFHPDKTHLHHVFVNIGISHFITSVCIQIINVVIVLLWLVMVIAGVSIDMQLYGVVLLSLLLVWGAYGFLRYQVMHHTRMLHSLTRYSVRTHLGHKDWWKQFTAWLDAPEFRQEKEMAQVEKVQAKRKLNRFDHLTEENFKEQDRKRLYEYLKGKAEVHVEDIDKYSGVNHLRLHTLIFEEEQNGYIVVVKRSPLGSPEIVYMVE